MSIDPNIRASIRLPERAKDILLGKTSAEQEKNASMLSCMNLAIIEEIERINDILRAQNLQ